MYSHLTEMATCDARPGLVKKEQQGARVLTDQATLLLLCNHAVRMQIDKNKIRAAGSKHK
jgi:hypothetical protein